MFIIHHRGETRDVFSDSTVWSDDMRALLRSPRDSLLVGDIKSD